MDNWLFKCPIMQSHVQQHRILRTCSTDAQLGYGTGRCHATWGQKRRHLIGACDPAQAVRQGVLEPSLSLLSGACDPARVEWQEEGCFGWC
eukprot:1155812-Pelagomonas_calceolata.AAC.2